MTELTFWTNPQSRGAIVRWMLEETGAPYDTIVLDYGAAMRDSAYLAVNPMAKVPAIRHGTQVVTEAAAICAYLADAFPAAGLAPAPAARGAYYRWLLFGAGPLEAAVTARALGLLAPPERRSMVGYGDFDSVLDTLQHAVAQADPWLAGPQFSAADVYTGSQILWGLRFGSIPERPGFADYAARLMARPAWQRAAALDAALREGKG